MATSSSSQRRAAIEGVRNRKCEACGNHTVDAATVEGFPILQCTMCEALTGDDDVISRIHTIRDARDAGIDVEVYPLVLTLNAISGVRCHESSGGDPFMRVPPYVGFVVGDNRITHLDNIANSIEMLRRELSASWRIHLEVKREGTTFMLQPQINAHDLDERSVEFLQTDLEMLAQSIERNKHLSWWKQ